MIVFYIDLVNTLPSNIYNGTEFTYFRNEGTGIPERRETSKPVPHLVNTTQPPVLTLVFHFEKLPVFHYEIIRTHKRIYSLIFHFSPMIDIRCVQYRKFTAYNNTVIRITLSRLFVLYF